MTKPTVSVRIRPKVHAWVLAQAQQRQLSVSATIDALLYEAMQGPTPARQAADKPQDVEVRKLADDTEAARKLLEKMFDK